MDTTKTAAADLAAPLTYGMPLRCAGDATATLVSVSGGSADDRAAALRRLAARVVAALPGTGAQVDGDLLRLADGRDAAARARGLGLVYVARRAVLAEAR